MNNALLSGLTGLRVNQQYLDVIGNNLANANTSGFKVKTMNFRDVLYQTISAGTSPSGTRGGINPFQVGRGVTVGSSGSNMIQGSILNTGRALDLAIQGRGFFVVSDGVRNYYTRAGSFAVDADDYVVDSGTGFRVQSVTGADIRIPSDAVSPPQATSEVKFAGNLPANVNGPLAEVLQTLQAFEEHTSASLTGIAGSPNFVFGPTDTLTVKVDRGAPQTVSFPAGTYTPTDLVNHLNANLSGATASLNGSSIVLTSDSAGENSVLHIVPSAGASIIFNASDQGVDIVGTENPASLTTDLNDLSSNITDYQDGATILISGTRPDGTSVSSTFTYGASNDGTTLQALLDHMSVIFDVQPGGAAWSFDATTGNVTWTAYETGAADFTITIRDDPNSPQPGSMNWNNHAYDPLVVGTDPDTATVTSVVHDATGQPHVVTFVFERQDDGTWNLTPEVDPSEGTVQTPTLTGIAFASDGSLLAVPTGEVIIDWNSSAGTQQINMNLGTAGNPSSVTQYGGDEPTITGEADGYPAGVLDSFEVRADGLIQGFFTNGQILDMDRLGIAIFANAEGLRAEGGNLWVESPNSGTAQIVGATDGAAGSIASRALEGSNVDIAEEFVKLIQAQRSFQASARIITTTDEVLAELVNLV